MNIEWGSDVTCPGVWIGAKFIPSTNWKWMEPLQRDIAYDYWAPEFPNIWQGDCLLIHPVGGEYGYMFANDFCQLNSGVTKKNRFICEVSEMPT